MSSSNNSRRRRSWWIANQPCLRQWSIEVDPRNDNDLLQSISIILKIIFMTKKLLTVYKTVIFLNYRGLSVILQVVVNVNAGLICFIERFLCVRIQDKNIMNHDIAQKNGIALIKKRNTNKLKFMTALKILLVKQKRMWS